MSEKNSPSELDATSEDLWPRKLNKLLIVIGVVAFGLIIADRLVNMFVADDLPAVVDVQQAVDTPDESVARTDESMAVEPDGEQMIVLPDVETEVATDALNIEDVFGAPLVFVSASEPFYVITEENVRIDIGSQLNADTTLAGVTGDRVILDRAGDLVSIALPEPDMQ